MIAIIDYGVGNLFSLASSFKAINHDVIVTSSPEDLHESERIILPGVGAFGDAAGKLFDSGLAGALINEAHSGKPVLGICLGMQLLVSKSYEFGEHDGLNLIPGEIRYIGERVPSDLKIPQIGWNALHLTQEGGVFANTHEGEYVYFVHSYSAICDGKFITAKTNYGADLTAAIRFNNIYGVQFHPEKSGSAGLEILRAFCEV